jgi:transaldolase
MLEFASQPYISGLTTNPSLMKKSGITNYELFAKTVLSEIPDKPISFEVLSDDLEVMKDQALKINSWANNVYVKIPICNTRGESTNNLIKNLSHNGVKVNVTAIMTVGQVESVVKVLNPDVRSYISVFAGRIADTGLDPIPMMQKSLSIVSANQNSELIWASPRELLNIFQADGIGCHIITASKDIIKKLDLIGKNLETFSLETVKMFHEDGLLAGYKI